jgi:DNA-binding NarL/FixJ family response regulator
LRAYRLPSYSRQVRARKNTIPSVVPDEDAIVLYSQVTTRVRVSVLTLLVIKADPNLNTIPTVILTTSDAEADIVRSYQLQANCYLNEPVQLDAFETLVKSINDFWLTKVKLPQQG